MSVLQTTNSKLSHSTFIPKTPQNPRHRFEKKPKMELPALTPDAPAFFKPFFLTMKLAPMKKLEERAKTKPLMLSEDMPWAQLRETATSAMAGTLKPGRFDKATSENPPGPFHTIHSIVLVRHPWCGWVETEIRREEGSCRGEQKIRKAMRFVYRKMGSGKYPETYNEKRWFDYCIFV